MAEEHGFLALINKLELIAISYAISLTTTILRGFSFFSQ